MTTLAPRSGFDWSAVQGDTGILLASSGIAAKESGKAHR